MRIKLWQSIPNTRTREIVSDHPPRKTQGFKKSKKDFSNYECFTCHKMGHIGTNFPMKEERFKKKNKILQAHVVEDNDQ